MTASAPAAAGADAALSGRFRDRIRAPLVQLNLIGIVLVAIAVAPARLGPTTVALVVLGVVALGLWAAWVLRPPGRVRAAAMLSCALVAAVGAGLGAPALIAPVIASVLVTVSDTERPARALIAPVLSVAVALVVSSAIHGRTVEDVLSLLAGIGFAVLGGYSRRQRRTAEALMQARLLSELAAEREAQRASLLEARSAAARDVHDVLAHSLGGLVLQLDAIEALLEHGRVDEAATRAAAARRLAGEGLAEARRAVAALRDPDAAAPVPVPADALDALLAAHRSLGGTVDATGDTALSGIDDAHRQALAGALREALVNARRHAPGAPVRVRVDRDARAVVLRVTNPLPSPARALIGGGHGLAGMQERFAALADGSTASAGPAEDRFVVEATAVLA